MSSSPNSENGLESLFAAAREDAPTESVRDAVWARVAAGTSVPVAGALAHNAVARGASGAAAKAAAAAKLLAIGAVLAGAHFLLREDAPSATAAGARRAPKAVATTHAGARLADVAPRGRAAPAPEPRLVLPERSEPDHGSSLSEPDHGSSLSEPAAADSASSLAEEARLVSEARLALVRGDPEKALALARGTRRLAARALEPEELGLEARALRALGRKDEAFAVELTLKQHYPSHTLSR